MAKKTQEVLPAVIVIGDGIYVTWDEARKAYEPAGSGTTSMYVVRGIEPPNERHPDSYEFDIDTGVPNTVREHSVNVPVDWPIRRDIRQPIPPSAKPDEQQNL